MMYRLCISIHACPPGAIRSGPVKVAGVDCELLQLGPAQQAAPMAVTFEQAVERLEQLPRFCIEADGSFVWTDRCERVVYVDVAGTCPQHEFDQLLRALGWPAARLLFQLPQHGVFLSEQDFRRCAGREEGVND